MGFRRNQGRKAAKAAEDAYPDDLGKAQTSSSMVSGLFRKIGTGEIPEEEIGKEAGAVEDQMKKNFPEAWNGGVGEVFQRFFGSSND